MTTYELNEKNKNTFCPLAWNHSFVNQDGSFQLCCTSEECNNYVRDEKGKILYVQDGHSVDTVVNSQYMKKIRLEMLEGKWPEACKRCLLTERLGGYSRRNVEFNSTKNDLSALIESTASDGSIPTSSITSADYRLGNLCNLQCRMCNPHSTKLWIKEWNDMKEEPEKFPKHVMESFAKYEWIDSPNLVRDLQEKAPGLRHIHFAGGEPLVVPQMADILQKCVESGNAKNILITYNTNLTILPQKVLDLWKHFRGVKILASIDAVGPLNYYIRYPAKWEQIDKNMRFIEEHHEEYNIKECMISATVQILNVLHLPQIYDYLSGFKFMVQAPNLVNLHFPIYFQTTILPQHLKEMATKRLMDIDQQLTPKLPDHYKYLTQNITAVLTHMNATHPQAEREFSKFIDFQKKFDAKKKLQLTDYCPEFSPFL